MKEVAEESLTDDLVLLMESRRGLPLGMAVVVNPVPPTYWTKYLVTFLPSPKVTKVLQVGRPLLLSSFKTP